MSTSESFRKEVAEKLDAVVKSPDPRASASFPSCLSAEERKYVHHLAERFGLSHDSRGHGDARFITVKRNPGKAERRGLGAGLQAIDDLPSLRLPPAAWDVLNHPFITYASTEARLEELNAGAPLFEVEPDEIGDLLGQRGNGQAPKGHSAASASSVSIPQGPPESPLLKARQRLPAWHVRDEMLQALESHQVTLVVGATGCGKSTQVPQFILERGEADTNIVITQPRRLSALALAHRVAQERNEPVGSTVGYSVHLDNSTSASTRMLYCTTGVFRRRFLADPQLSNVTHLVLDELHERDKITDFLLIAVKELLIARPALRVVLMSATMQHDTFRRYFPGCAEVSIAGRSFPVEDYYLEDFAPLVHRSGHVAALGPGFAAGGLGYGTWEDKGNEKSFKYQVLVSHARDRDGLCGYSYNASKPLSGDRLEEGLFLHDVLQQTKGVTFDLPIVEALLSFLVADRDARAMRADSGEKPSAGCGGILVFLPGWDDIDKLKRRLRAHNVLGDSSRFSVLVLHSQIQLEQQREVFKPPAKGVRKIILSTNIAETSLTIDDVDVVVDCGRSKETSFDAFLSVPTLNTSWVSRASMAQRAGRAGRTKPGVCYHVFSRRRANLLDAHRPPEMLRTALDDVCLHARLLLTCRGQPEVPLAGYLLKAPDPPEERSILGAEALLRGLGALTRSVERPGQLTALGVHLSVLPLTPQLAKAIIWANILGVGNSMITIASGLQYREPFVGIGDTSKPTSMVEANKTIRRAKRALSARECSDHIALLRACQGFKEASSRGTAPAREFCEANSVSYRQMQTLIQTCGKLQSELRARGFSCESADRNGDDEALLIAALSAGLFPNLAHHSPKARQKMRVQEGRLEAVPHPASIASFSDKGAGPWDHGMSAAAQQSVDDEGNGGGETTSDRWFCFQELSQVEDHYSLSGLSRIPVSAMLLLCGEGDLLVREAEDGSEVVDASTGEVVGQPRDRQGDDVIVSIPELGDWFAVKLKREAASRVQVLRAMLRFLFRVYCCEPSRWQEVVAEGKIAELVLDLAERIIHAEAGQSDELSSVYKASSAHASSGNPSASTSRADHARNSKGSASSASGIAPGQAQRDKRVTGKTAAQPAASAQRQNQSFYSASSNGRIAEAKPGKVKGMYSAEAWESGGDRADASSPKSPTLKANQPVKTASGKQTTERKSKLPGHAPAATHPKSGTGQASNAFRCGLCSSAKAESEGCLDTTDNSWYCWDCWGSYYESQRAPASSSWSWGSSWY